MYKPANIREFVTPAKHKKVIKQLVMGREVETIQEAPKPNLRGKFKLKGTTETTQNGLVVVNDKTTYTTWWKSDFESSDILTINGVDYRVIGTPENVEGRGRYAVLNLEKVEGGANG